MPISIKNHFISRLTIFEMPKNNQTGKPFPMKGNPSGVSGLKVGGIRQKRKVRCLYYVGPEMMIKELFCVCVGLGRKKDGEGWAWAKCGTCLKCFFLDSHSIKELFSLEGLQALASLFYYLDKSFIEVAILQNWPRTHINPLIKSYKLVLPPHPTALGPINKTD